MSVKRRIPQVVIDTNLVLSALVFAQGRLTPLRHSWQNAQCLPLISNETASELLRVLTYPKFKLTQAERHELLAAYIPWCKTVVLPQKPPATPPCRDPFDIPFLQLAMVGNADFLVTADQDLLSLAEKFGRPIVSAARFLETLNK